MTTPGKDGCPSRPWPSISHASSARATHFSLRLLAALLWSGGLAAAPSANLRLPKNQDCFFIEENFVYRRCLSLSHDGTYRQVNQDGTATVEADRGTWEQDASAVVALHSTGRGLRFRALLSGPLAVVLDSPGRIAALPGVAAAIGRLLAASEDAVFTAPEAGGLGAPPAVVSVDRQAETFSRADLTDLAAQIAQTIQTEGTRTYRLTPVRLPGRPLLLVLAGAVFGPARAAPTCRQYAVPRGAAPPFYFARVDGREFTRRVGVWRELAWPGGPSQP